MHEHAKMIRPGLAVRRQADVGVHDFEEDRAFGKARESERERRGAGACGPLGPAITVYKSGNYHPIRCCVHTQRPTWILSGVYPVCTALTITESLGAAKWPARNEKRTTATTGKDNPERGRQKGSLFFSFQCSALDPISSPSTSYQRPFFSTL